MIRRIRPVLLALALCHALPGAAQEVDPATALIARAGDEALAFPPGSVEAEAGADQYGRPVVFFRLDAERARAFGALTAAHIGEVIELALCGKVLTAPMVREPIPGGSGQISGDCSEDAAPPPAPADPAAGQRRDRANPTK